MDLDSTGDLNSFEIRSPRCIQLVLDRVIRYERASGNTKKAVDICESLLLTGMVLFGSREPANRECAIYLADLCQQMSGSSTDALTLNYAFLLDCAAHVDTDDDGLEVRLRMAEIIYDLNVNRSSDLMKGMSILLAEDLLRDALEKLGPADLLTFRAQRHVIRAQSQHMELDWTLRKFEELLKVVQDAMGRECRFYEETKRIMAHNLQEVILRIGIEKDTRAQKTKSIFHSSKSTKLLENLSSETLSNETTKTDHIESTANEKDLFLCKSLTAASLLAQGKLHLAVQLYQELLFYTSSTFGETDPITLCTKQTLAAVLDQQGRFDEALLNYKETLTTANSALGNNHRVTRIARKQLDELTKKLDRLNAICSYYTHERLKSDWFNRVFVLIMAGFLLWLLIEVYVDHIR